MSDPNSSIVNSVNKPTSQSEEKLEMFLAKALATEQYKPTESQVDKLISLQEKSMEYTFKERTQVLPKHSFDRKIDLAIMIFGTIVFLIIFCLVLAFKPELTNIILAGVISFIGGFGAGRSNILRKKSEAGTE